VRQISRELGYFTYNVILSPEHVSGAINKAERAENRAKRAERGAERGAGVAENDGAGAGAERRAERERSGKLGLQK